MAPKNNNGLRQLKAEEIEAIETFRSVQNDLKKLRELEVAEVEIRRIMVQLGFAGVTRDEFIGAKTTRQMMAVIKKLELQESN